MGDDHLTRLIMSLAMQIGVINVLMHDVAFPRVDDAIAGVLVRWMVEPAIHKIRAFVSPSIESLRLSLSSDGDGMSRRRCVAILSWAAFAVVMLTSVVIGLSRGLTWTAIGAMFAALAAAYVCIGIFQFWLLVRVLLTLKPTCSKQAASMLQDVVQGTCLNQEKQTC